MLIVLAIIFVFLIQDTSLADDRYKLLPGVIHLDSQISGAPLTPEEIVRRAKIAGLKVAIFSDKDANKVEYGVFPLRNLIKRSVEKMSISDYGAERYIRYIEEINKQYPDIVILPGAETTPFYYWEGSIWNAIKDGSIFSGAVGLKVKNYHKNILVFGLKNAEDFENIPSVIKKKPRELSLMCIPNLWPFLLILFGLKRLYYTKGYPFTVGISARKTTKKIKTSSLVIIVIGIIFLVNNFPFCNPKFDQYHGDKDSAPYQELIDYVNSKGGLTFWSAPDVTTATYKYGPVIFETQPYYHELINTRDYTGFAVFAEGMKNSGVPGGIWDQVLIQYIEGKRNKPVWAIGELDYEEGDWMGETQTVFLVRDNTKDEILLSLREGRVYAVTGDYKIPKPILERFQIWDDVKKKWIEMGGTAVVKGVTRMRIKITIPRATQQEYLLRVIREGKVIKTINIKGSFEDTIEINYKRKGGMTYYRLDLNSQLISNPIFCDFRI